jgi:cysteine-rich repeat protein
MATVNSLLRFQSNCIQVDPIATTRARYCDDGNSNNNDSCTNEFENASCCDGFVQPGEDCDDSNNNNQDSCSNACKNPRGEDGIVQTGEECDDERKRLETDGKAAKYAIVETKSV